MKAMSFEAATGRNTRIAPQNARRRAMRRWLQAALTRMFALLREWRRRVRSRAELAALDERMLRDIGVTRAEICHEINKPFWRK